MSWLDHTSQLQFPDLKSSFDDMICCDRKVIHLWRRSWCWVLRRPRHTWCGFSNRFMRFVLRWNGWEFCPGHRAGKFVLVTFLFFSHNYWFESLPLQILLGIFVCIWIQENWTNVNWSPKNIWNVEGKIWGGDMVI